jgi:hypothetical protein
MISWLPFELKMKKKTNVGMKWIYSDTALALLSIRYNYLPYAVKHLCLFDVHQDKCATVIVFPSNLTH